MPAVLDEDELPFVLGFADDARPAIEVGGAYYRRGGDGYVVEWPAGEVWLRARAMTIGPRRTAIMASAGPILNEWWPLLCSAPEDPARPLLSAGVGRRSVDVPMRSAPAVPVRVVPAGDLFPQTVALCAEVGDIDDEANLLAYHFASLGVIKAAVGILLEYHGLVGEPPEMDIAFAGGTVPLAAMLETAAQVASALGYPPVPSGRGEGALRR
jgi:hypothetical protein